MGIPSGSLVGETVADKYLVLSELGSGGFGGVYMAKHQELNNPVAIKVLHGHLISSEETVTRFRREATATSRLRHNSITSVFDFGVLTDGRPYMVMEFLSGDSLANIIYNEGSLPFERALPLFIECCDALRYAHRKGLLHRDIKPDNIYIVRDMDGEEHAKLLDFGLAKIVYGDDGGRLDSLTGSGMMLGTPWYMSPEQCQAMPLDGRSDIYSLAYSLYETLCGHRPFGGATQYETMHNHLHAKVPPLNEPDKQPIVPQPLESAILRALSKSPNDRFNTADELKDTLVACLPQGSAALARAKSPAQAAYAQAPTPAANAQASTPVMRSAGAATQGSGNISKSVGAASSTVIAGALVVLSVCVAIGAGLWWMRSSVSIKPAALDTTDAPVKSPAATSLEHSSNTPASGTAPATSPAVVASPAPVAPAPVVQPVAQPVVQPVPQPIAQPAVQTQQVIQQPAPDERMRALEAKLHQLEQQQAAQKMLRETQWPSESDTSTHTSGSSTSGFSSAQPYSSPASHTTGSNAPPVYAPNGQAIPSGLPFPGGSSQSGSSWAPPTSSWKPGDPLPPGYPAPPWGPPRPEDGGGFILPGGGPQR